jgi:predicted  nucleic acid-binding Zn-ribbon protein
MVQTPDSDSAVPANTVDLDGVSLRQALLDFEVANARVIDLTKRLTAMNKELVKTTTALQKAQLRNRRLDQELKAIKTSRAFRSAEVAMRVARGARSRIAK